MPELSKNEIELKQIIKNAWIKQIKSWPEESKDLAGDIKVDKRFPDISIERFWLIYKIALEELLVEII